MNNREDVKKTLVLWNSKINKHIDSLQKDVEKINITTFKKIRSYYRKSDKEVQIKDMNAVDIYINGMIQKIHSNPSGTYKISNEPDKEISILISDLTKLYIKYVRILKDMCSRRYYYDEMSLLKKYAKHEDYQTIKANLYKCINLKMQLSKIYTNQIIVYLRLIKKNLKETNINESVNTILSERIRDCIEELKI